MAGILRRFDFDFAGDLQQRTDDLPGNSDVGMRTGATIHTENGLWLVPRRRTNVPARVRVPAPGNVTV
jgi:hypothetical protein